MPEVEFKSNGDTASGYLAVPESGKGPGVVVLQEWWGLVPHIEGLAGRFARRVKAWANANGVPVIYCKAGERKHRIAEEYLAEHPDVRRMLLDMKSKVEGIRALAMKLTASRTVFRSSRSSSSIRTSFSSSSGCQFNVTSMSPG